MITRRKLLIGIGLGTASAALPSLAQQAKVARIGILSARSRSTPSNPDPDFDAFVRGMRELGYVDGKNIILDWRFADEHYERLPELAVGMVQAKPDVLVTHATPVVQALMRATKTIPIVMTAVSDPVGSGFTTSLSRPDRNVTGLSIVTIDLSPKRVEFLKYLLPDLSTLAVVLNPGTAFHPELLKGVEAAAKSRGIQVLAFPAGTAQELDAAFGSMQKQGVTAAILASDAFFISQRQQIARIAIRHKVATMAWNRSYVLAGGLMAYGPDIAAGFRRAAVYVDKILKGAKPIDLPIEQPSIFQLVINGKTAKALGLRIPQELRGRADEIIE